MPRLSKDEWAMLAKDYAADISVAQLARKYGIARQTIMERAKNQSWTIRPKEEIYDATQAKLQGVSSDATPEAKAALTGAIADERAVLVRQHRQAWAKVYSIREDAHRIMEGQRPKKIRDVKVNEGITELMADLDFKDVKERVKFAALLISIFEADARALSTAQEGERRSNGMDYKAQSEAGKVDEAEAREKRELLKKLAAMAPAFGAMAPQ